MLTKIRSKIKSRTRDQKQDDQAPTPSIQDKDGASTDISKRRNLWEVAGKRLDEKSRIALGLENACSITDSIEEVIKTTEEKYREYKEGGLKIRKRDGGQMNVRDSAQSIIRYTLLARDKTFASFDPSGLSSSAWSVVSIALTLMKNDIERRDDIFEAAEYLAQTLSFYTIIDNDYRERGVGSDTGLEAALVEVYAAVLEYAAKVKEAAQESSAGRVLKSITALVQQPLRDLKETVRQTGQAAQNWANITADLDQREQADRILEKVDQDSERLKAIQAQAKKLQDQEILDWLSIASYSDTQNDTQARRAPNTGNWFLDSPAYKEWKFSPGKICWGYGAVGCGKSVLCSAVIQDIMELCETDSSKKIAYWYFQFSNDETQKVYNMVRSILRQLMPWKLPVPLIKLWEDHSHRGSKPGLQKFADILDTFLETSQDESYLILDAMDECPATEHDGRNFLLKFIADLSAKHPSKLHIFATSRPEPDIRLSLQQYESVDIEAGLGGDVETFVRHQNSHDRLSQWDEPIKKRALEKLLDIPERRFRWADLQIKRLQKSKNESEFHKALDTIPVTLEDTYRDILERLSPDDRDAARTILIWLSFSLVPLDLKTVADVVSFRFPEDVVKTCTTSLVTVSISNDAVRLAHFSVKEFLVCDETRCHWYQFSDVSGHIAILNKAIDSLLETTGVIVESTADQRPLLKYSARNWGGHLVEVRDVYIRCTLLQEKVDRLFNVQSVYFNWVRLSSDQWEDMWYRSFQELISPLSLASKLGLEPTVRNFLARNTDPGIMILECSTLENNALRVAAEAGHLDILELLIKSVDQIPRRIIHRIILFMTVTEANKERLPIILDLLWDKDCLHDQSRSSQKIIDEELVEAAAMNRKCGCLLMDQLLDRKQRMGIKITERLLELVARNDALGAIIMNLIFDQCDTDIKLTQSLMEQIVFSGGADGAIVCMDRRMDGVNLDEEFLRAISGGKKEQMELFLQKQGDKVRITQMVLIEAAWKATDPQMVSLLLKR